MLITPGRAVNGRVFELRHHSDLPNRAPMDKSGLLAYRFMADPVLRRIKKAIPTIRHSAQPIDDDFDIQFKKNITILCTSSQSFVVHSPSVTTAATFKAIMYTISIYYSVESYGFDVE